MTTAGRAVWLSHHGEPILLALVLHELAAGAAFTIAGLPGAGSFLWAIGAGLALADVLVHLVLWARARRPVRRLLGPIVLLVAVVVAAASGFYGAANLLGALGVLAVVFPGRLRRGS